MKKIIDKIMKNKKILIGGLAILSVFFGILTVLLNKSSLANVEEEDSLSINCSDTSYAGNEIECSIVLNTVTMGTRGINANYKVAEDMSFVMFSPGEIWTSLGNRENENETDNPSGFVLVNFETIKGSNIIGTIKYRIPSTATSNEQYRVELIDATIGDGENKTKKFENVYDDIRIISDINTIENITLSSGEGTFDKENKEYNGTINGDKVTIGVIKTDNNSTISGGGEVNLHYGTNIFNITVTSESGIENIYKVNIYRPYEFSSDIYTYNKQNNYIYTGNDADSISILTKIKIPRELISNIENNKLRINYGEEKLLEIDVINIKSNKYSIEDQIIYIEKNQSYDEFMDSITLNGVTIKVFDNNGSQVNSGTIHDGYKFKIYYQDNNEPLEVYTFNEEYYRIEELDIDENNKVIKNIKFDTTYNDIISNITTTGTITVKNKDGNKVNKNNKAKTGETIEIKLSDKQVIYTVSVLGDINGDGKLNMGDIGVLYRYFKGRTELETYQVFAGDVIKDNNIKISDVSRMYRYYRGKVGILEVNN